MDQSNLETALSTRPPETSEDRFAASLAALGVGRSTLRRLLADLRPRRAWEMVCSGRHPVDGTGSLARKARPEWPAMFDERLARCGARVLVRDGAGYPSALADDVDAPEVLFCIGEPETVEGRPLVTIVGTRSATRYGLEVAAELASGLASCGVVVVSGLAPGIDSSAHSAAVRMTNGAPPAAFVATGVDIASPRSTATVRDAVASRGAVISELPPGVSGERWRFADRNRLMAAVSHVVVVVECHHSGGALNAVDAARQRGTAVMAVPGSVHSPASFGTNGLLADGAPPARDVEDVLTALELATAGDNSVRHPLWPKRVDGRSTVMRPVPPSGVAAKVFAVLESEPASLENVVRRCGSTLGEVAAALEQLDELALADGEGGWWRRRGRI
jgi:DNA processing protein